MGGAARAELSPSFGEHWLLVGGRMVFVHEVHRNARDIRPTDDIDVVVDLRVQPTALATMHSSLLHAGFTQDQPNPEGIAHRYRRNGAVIDVLAPDNIGARARLRLGQGRTLSAPGTTQAFRRSHWMTITLARGPTADVRLPTVIGALLGVDDRRTAACSRTEQRLIAELAQDPRLTALARASLKRLLAPSP